MQRVLRFEITSSTRRMTFAARHAWLKRMQNMGSIFLKLDFFITYVPTRASGVAVVAEPREKNPVSLLSKVLPSGPPQPSAMEQTIDDAALRLVLYVSLLFPLLSTPLSTPPSPSPSIALGAWCHHRNRMYGECISSRVIRLSVHFFLVRT